MTELTATLRKALQDIVDGVPPLFVYTPTLRRLADMGAVRIIRQAGAHVYAAEATPVGRAALKSREK